MGLGRSGGLVGWEFRGRLFEVTCRGIFVGEIVWRREVVREGLGFRRFNSVSV